VSKVEREQIRQAIQQLSQEFREIIALREFAELSYQEIATLLNCPLGTVMSRLGRARSKLGTLLSATQIPFARQAEWGLITKLPFGSCGDGFGFPQRIGLHVGGVVCRFGAAPVRSLFGKTNSLCSPAMSAT
jgi:hypothetical protein